MLDYFKFEQKLTDEQRMLIATVRSFVSKEIAPLIADCYRREEFPTAIIKRMGELGLLGTNLALDGKTKLLDQTSYGLVMRELERIDSGVRSFASVQGALVMYPIHAYGNEEQQRWLPKLQSGAAVGCFALTEQHGGSDPENMQTRAIETADGNYEINGTKTWITNGNIADIAIVWAKLADEVRGFLVPCQSKGLLRKKINNKLSLRASITSELVFQKVKIPRQSLLPRAIGMRAALSCLTQARYGIAWGAIGAAEACFAEALDFVKNRAMFGAALAAKQLVQRKLALIATKITTAQLLALRLGELKDNDELKFTQVSMAKQYNVAAALAVARTCRDMLGAYGITDEYQTMRHMCNLETVSTYEGTSDIHLLIIGHDLTGIAAYGEELQEKD